MVIDLRKSRGTLRLDVMFEAAPHEEEEFIDKFIESFEALFNSFPQIDKESVAYQIRD